GQRSHRGPMSHGAVEVEPRAVARAVEALVGVVQRDRTTQVRAVDCQDMHLALLVLDREAPESQVAGGVVAATVGHDEGRVRGSWSVELDRVAVRELVDRLPELDLDLAFL